ncbi:SNF2-related protein [Rhodanobacter umsongensis]
MAVITLSYDGDQSIGIFRRGNGVSESLWVRLRSAAQASDQHTRANSHIVSLTWPAALSVLRNLSYLQDLSDFEFAADDTSEERIMRFMSDVAAVQGVIGEASIELSEDEIRAQLQALGWDISHHNLKSYQLANVRRLAALSNGANFSVPGAGKTTVTFALALLTQANTDRILVVAPPNAFPAWEEVIDECLLPTALQAYREPFTRLAGGEAKIRALLETPAKRFIISYDQLVRVDALIDHYLSTHNVHLILDESHKMKAGSLARRGMALLRMGHLAVRRDILSGTPMPQSSRDIESQLDFLWPGTGLGSRIAAGEAPRDVMGALYVRTTKHDLDLPARERREELVTITPAHLAFYAVLKEDVFARASELRKGKSAPALIKARRSVMRLLQAAVNPELVATSISETVNAERANGLLKAVIDEGVSARVVAAVALVERLVAEGRKVLVWTIFTSTLLQLRDAMAHLNPAVIYGATGLGDEADDASRQGQLRIFKDDANCHVMIANPAAAAEGISLHMHCHDAVYVDRSYNATHFLQSIDRIHRLGLPSDVVTTVYVMQNVLPPGVGSIDRSVARRLTAKIRNMQALLDDPDLHELALDEENASSAIEDSIDEKDISDLVAELEAVTPTSDGCESLLE